jgi:hypothetical protein
MVFLLHSLVRHSDGLLPAAEVAIGSRIAVGLGIDLHKVCFLPQPLA